MDKSICKKAISLMFLYIENKINNDDKNFLENHFKQCSDCYSKYIEMKDVVKNLHLEYEKLLNDFERIESNKSFRINEYEYFCKNISPYIDDELNYDDSIKFRKYLLKSKSARNELAQAYNLKNNIKHSIALFKANLNFNLSKKIIKRLKSENKYSYESVYQRAAALIGIMVALLIFVSLFVSFNHMNHSLSKVSAATVSEPFMLFDDSDMVEFTFDYGHEALILNK